MFTSQESLHLRLDQITLDKKIQPRVVIQNQIVIDYCDCYLQGDKFPNITVFFDGKKYWLADGWHRYYAAQLAKFTEIECDVIKGTYRDALRFSLSANAEHGKSLSLQAKRKIVMNYVSDPETCHMSAREINRASGISMHDINNILIKKSEQEMKKSSLVPENS